MSAENENNQKDKKVTIGCFAKYRRSKNVRMGVVIVLLLIIVALYFLWGKAKIALIAIAAVLLLALGLEISGNDWDLGKLVETGSLSESKIEKSENGNWLIDDERCAKEALNCSIFNFQEEAQEMFEYCGGIGNDIHRLDGDKDGVVCEALPRK